MKFTNKKVVIFDLDGTLIDSAPDLAVGINHMLTNLNRKSFSEDTIRGWVGNGASVLVKRALSGGSDIDKSIDSELFSKALEIFLTFYAKNLCVNTVTYRNVKTTLKTLKNRGYTLAIATNKPFDFVEPILKGLNLDGLFKVILGGDSLKEKKPAPMMLLYICKKLKVEVDQSIMVGDSKNDILAANAANIQSIGLTYGYNYDEDISIHNPDIVFDNFLDILTVL